MNDLDLSDKTTPPRRTVRYDTPAELYAAIPQIQGLTQSRPRAEEDNLQFLVRLRGSTTPEEAVTFTAFAALPTAAAGWGYECLRQMAEYLNPVERPLMQDIATWIANPTSSMRYKLMRDALWAPSRSPSVLLGLAVGWSTGGPAPNDPMRPPEWRTPQSLNSAVLSCLARAELSRRSVYLARIINMAESLLRPY